MNFTKFKEWCFIISLKLNVAQKHGNFEEVSELLSKEGRKKGERNTDSSDELKY
jgi:hypothetical protein